MEEWINDYLTKTDFEKWQGLRKEVLKKYRLYIHKKDITDKNSNWFLINSTTCMLCNNFQEYSVDEGVLCLECPLYQSLGKRCDDGIDSPFQIWSDTENPEPMIKALEKIKDQLPLRNEKVNQYESFQV